MQSKGELRRARKKARADGQAWTIEQEDGQLKQVRTRTKKEEAKHQKNLDNWARRFDESN